MVNMPLRHYIDFVLGDLSARGAGFPDEMLPLPPNRTYLFDWPISNCPSPTILDDLIIPRIFANDMLVLCRMYEAGSNSTHQHCPYNNGDWPSLFIGIPGLKGSPLHRDNFGAAFFSIQLRGTKRWRVFATVDSPLLYPSLSNDVQFSMHDTFAGTANSNFPLTKFAGKADVLVGRGDLFYVPAGSPHQVEILDTGEEEGAVNVMLAFNYVSAANLERVIKTTAPQILEGTAFTFRTRLYKPLHDFFSLHKASLLRNVDWNIGHTRFRDFASRTLPHVCMSHLAFSVDGEVTLAMVNTLMPDVDASASQAARLHPLAEGLEVSLRSDLVQHLRLGANGDCKERMVEIARSHVRQHQPLLFGFCPSLATQLDFQKVEHLVQPIEAGRLIAWARAQVSDDPANSDLRVKDTVKDTPSFTFDLPVPTLQSLAEIMMPGGRPGNTSARLRQRLLTKLWPAFAALPVAAGDARLDSPAWLETDLWNSVLRDDVHGFVRRDSSSSITRPGLQMHRGGATYSVNIALNEGSEFEGGDVMLVLGGERRSLLLAPLARRSVIGLGIAFGANVPHVVGDVTTGQRWSLVLFFKKVLGEELPPCFTHFHEQL
jgi:hypothetical protein